VIIAPEPRLEPAPAPYAATGQGRDRRRRRRRGASRQAGLWRLEMTLGAVVLVALTVVLTTWPSQVPARPMPPGLALAHSGLVVDEPFDRAVPDGTLLDSYVFNGSAHPGVGWVAGTAHGLEVGVHPHPGWQGWFAVTLHSAPAATVWHAVVHRPAGTSEKPVEAVLAVQSASTQHNGTIDYVVVSSLTVHGRSTWQVGSAHGVVADAVTRFLWRQPLRRRAAVTQAVTLRTDGRHDLEVWFGDRLVYRSTTLDMHDPPPFQAYLEVQAEGRPYVAGFTDFWVTADAPVTVRGLAPGSRLVLSTGDGPVRAVADAGGVAELHVPPPVLSGTGTLVVTRDGASRRYAGLHYAGGDVIVAG